MGRHPANGGPSFRFSSAEVAEMEAILQKHEGNVPARDFLMALAQSFSNSADRAGKTEVQMKQVWSWFQNRRFARKGKIVKSPGPPITSPVTRDQATSLRNVPGVPQKMAVSSGPRVVNSTSEDPQMEFEARSARDGAWYDVQAFVSHRNLETDNPEVRVRFAGFEPEEDEWVSVLKHVRQRSLPCEAAECIIVGPGDLILCFQEGKEQALYFDAHVLDAQRRRHDVRGCRCRFLVRYDHDESEEIVPLRKICRRPETDYRLQVLHAANETAPPASVPTEPPKPAAVAAAAAAVSIPTPPVASTAPSVQTSATQASTPTFVRAPEAPASVPTPPSSVLPVSPESKKVESDNPVLVRVPGPIEVKSENTAAITALSNLKIEGGASVPAPAPIKVESANLGTPDNNPAAEPNVTAPAAANTVVSENTNPETTATTRSEISVEQPATASIDPSNTALESNGTNEAPTLNQQPDSTTITVPTTY